MKLASLAFVLLALCDVPVLAQQEAAIEAEIKRVTPYTRMLRTDPTLTITDYNAVVRAVAKQRARQQSNDPATVSAPCGSNPLSPDVQATLPERQRCQGLNSRPVEHPATPPRVISTRGAGSSMVTRTSLGSRQ
jgi:hypothetical protein